MDYEAAIRDVIKYPVRGDHALRRVLVGGGLMIALFGTFLVGFFLAIFLAEAVSPALALLVGLLAVVVPVIGGTLYQGYVVRVMRTTLAGEDELPSWGDPVDLFVEGMWAFAVLLVYQVAIFAVYVALYVVVIAFVVVGAGTAGSEGGSAVFGALTLFYPIVMVLSMVLSLVVGYFSMVSLVTYAHEGSVRTALSPSRIRRVAFSKEFAVTFLVGYAGMTVVGNVLGLLVFVLVGFFVLFGLQTALFRLFALGYAGAMGLDVGDDGEGPDRRGETGEYRRVDRGGAYE